ncbi:MAG: metallophosphoesterase family protein [Burkholderiales bacterium]|nr:metallophosphoesterase family protein [Burkholderiales bacterium]
MPLIGLISDTHGLLRPEALAGLAGCDHILHAGDIGAPEVLERLAGVAPVTAVRGNNDIGAWAGTLPEAITLDLFGLAIHLLHDRAALAIDPARVDVVVCGHSHRPSIRDAGGVLEVNPGSAGPRRFRLPVSIALLAVTAGRGSARLVALDASAVAGAPAQPR